MTDYLPPNQDLIDRYVQNRLTREEEERFELWLMENPDVVVDIQAAIAMRDGVKAGRAPEWPGERSRGSVPGWLEWLFGPRRALATGIASLIILALPTMVAIQIATENRSLRAELAHLGQPTAIVHELPLELVRGGTDRIDGRIILGTEPETVMIRIPVHSWQGQASRFGLTIETADGAIDYPDIEISPSGDIRVALNTAAMDVGIMTLSVSGDGKPLVRFRVAVESR